MDLSLSHLFICVNLFKSPSPKFSILHVKRFREIVLPMKKLFLFICFLTITLFSCGKIENNRLKPCILVSIPPYKTLVEEIAGDDFEICSVAPLHADPHHYEPTPKQIAQIIDSKLWFRIGESFEIKLLSVLKQTESVDLCEQISFLESQCCHKHEKDRHFWLSPAILKVQAEKIASTLSQKFPSQKHAFDIRLKKTLVRLDHLDKDIKNRLDGATSKTFIVAHPAFGYYCKDYNCHQISLEKEGKDLRPQELESILRLANKTKASFAISLPQHSSKGTNLLAQKLSIPSYTLDPYSPKYEKTIQDLTSMIDNSYEN